MTFDPLLALRVLQDHDVRFVLIGGLAAELIGAPLTTNDVDVCYERSRGNADRLAAALRLLNARLRVAGVDVELPFQLDGQTILAGDSFTFDTDAGWLDVLATPTGTGGFADLLTGASRYDLGHGLVVDIVSVDDLIRMKRASGRAKDHGHLLVLEALKRVLAEETSASGNAPPVV